MKTIQLKQMRGRHVPVILALCWQQPFLLFHSEAEQAKQAPAKKRGRKKAPEPPGALPSCIHQIAIPQIVEHGIVSFTTDLSIYALDV